MQTCVDEIANGIHRLSTFIAETPPDGFTFNQYLIDADEAKFLGTIEAMEQIDDQLWR